MKNEANEESNNEVAIDLFRLRPERWARFFFELIIPG